MGKQLNLKHLGLMMAIVALAAVVINELHPFQSNSIYLLLAAGFAAILPYLESFKAGGVEVNLQKVIEEKMDEVKNETARAVKHEARLAREGGGIPGGVRKAEDRSFTLPETEEAISNQPPTISQHQNSTQANDAALQQLIRSIKTPADLAPDDDTWALVEQFKNLSAENSERALTAKIKKDEDDPDWYRIEVTLAAVGSGKPVVGRVYFLIHHTFPQAKIPVTAKDGQAKLERYTYGAFTVVALADGGRTKLKLDLAEVPNVPKGFVEG